MRHPAFMFSMCSISSHNVWLLNAIFRDLLPTLCGYSTPIMWLLIFTKKGVIMAYRPVQQIPCDPMDTKTINPNTGKPRITSKLNAWFKFYIDDCNKKTYLNKTESARAAGYKCKGKNPEDCFCQIGSQNFRKLKDRVSQWYDEIGLSENALKNKILELMSVKEKKFFSATMKDVTGEFIGIHIEHVEVDAIETQRKTLDMALKVKDMMSPIQHELANKKGNKLQIEHSLDDSWKELLLAVTGDNTDELPTTED